MSIKPLPAPGFEPSRVQGFLHSWGKLSLRLFSFLSRFPSSVSRFPFFFSRAPLPPCPPALLFLLSLVLLPLCSPSAVRADWGPEQQVTNWRGIVLTLDAASSGDTIHAMFTEYWVDSTGHEEVLYTRSTDAGITWSPEIVFTYHRGANCPRLASKGNIVHAIWTDDWYGQWDIFYRRSTDGGVTWNPETRFSFNGEPGRYPDVITDNGNGVYAFGKSSRGLHFRRSTDQGATWSQDTIITPFGPDIQFMYAAWSAGVLVIDWQDHRYTTSEVFCKRSTDGGSTWGPDTILSTRDVYPGQDPCLAADTIGNFYATWYDFKYSPYSQTGDILMRVSRDSGVSWLPEDTVMFSHRALNSSVLPWRGYLHVVYEDERDQPGRLDTELYGKVSTNLGVTFGPETRLTYSAPRSMGPVLVGTKNRVHLLWSEAKVADTLSELYHRWWEPGTGVEEDERDEPGRRQEFKIAVSPNPVSKACLIALNSVGLGSVVVKIYDVLGREVRRFEIKDLNRVRWDLTDSKGMEVVSGVYFVKAESEGIGFGTNKVTVIRSYK